MTQPCHDNYLNVNLVVESNAFSFYWSEIILDRPNHFGRVPIVLDKPNLFRSGPNNFGQVGAFFKKYCSVRTQKLHNFNHEF